VLCYCQQKKISDFVQQHPAIKVLALAFLVMIGTTLIAEGTGFHIPKGYVYVSMFFCRGGRILTDSAWYTEKALIKLYWLHKTRF
jgi:predicted tellurium resistance membrane protein TerC